MLRRKRAISIARIGLRSPPEHDETNRYRKEQSDHQHPPSFNEERIVPVVREKTAKTDASFATMALTRSQGCAGAS
jgi:hypothetical protein